MTLKNSGHHYTLAQPGTTKNAVRIDCIPDGVTAAEVLRRANRTTIMTGIAAVNYARLGLGRIVFAGTAALDEIFGEAI